MKDFQKELGCCKSCVALENMPLVGGEIKRRPYVLNDFKDMIKFGTQRNLYFTFDTTHIATFEHDAIDAFRHYAKTGRLKHVHLSDYAAERSHLFPGTGHLPLEGLLDAMVRPDTTAGEPGGCPGRDAGGAGSAGGDASRGRLFP